MAIAAQLTSVGVGMGAAVTLAYGPWPPVIAVPLIVVALLGLFVFSQPDLGHDER